MLHQLTLRFRPINLSGAPFADDPHPVGSQNQVHLRGLILFPVSLSGLYLPAEVKLTRAKIASATVAVRHTPTMASMQVSIKNQLVEATCYGFKMFRVLIAIPTSSVSVGKINSDVDGAP